jgi:hypothetical protein
MFTCLTGIMLFAYDIKFGPLPDIWVDIVILRSAIEF